MAIPLSETGGATTSLSGDSYNYTIRDKNPWAKVRQMGLEWDTCAAQGAPDELQALADSFDKIDGLELLTADYNARHATRGVQMNPDELISPNNPHSAKNRTSGQAELYLGQERDIGISSPIVTSSPMGTSRTVESTVPGPMGKARSPNPFLSLKSSPLALDGFQFDSSHNLVGGMYSPATGEEGGYLGGPSEDENPLKNGSKSGSDAGGKEPAVPLAAAEAARGGADGEDLEQAEQRKSPVPTLALSGAINNVD